MGRAAISGTLTTTHSVRNTVGEVEEEGEMIGVQKRGGERKQESSAANGNESCIKPLS